MALFYLQLFSHLRLSLWLGVLVIGGLAMGGHYFIEQVALVENAQAALAVSSWLAHLLWVVFLVIWWAGLLAQEHESRFDQVLYALPHSRLRVLVVRFASWAAASVLFAMVSGVILWGMGAQFLFALQWAVSFVLELWMVLALVLFYANLTTQVAVVTLATMLSYVLLRLLPFLALLSHKVDFSLQAGPTSMMQSVIGGVAGFLPSLQSFATSEILLSGVAWSVLAQQALVAGVFALFMLFLAGFDLERKELQA